MSARTGAVKSFHGWGGATLETGRVAVDDADSSFSTHPYQRLPKMVSNVTTMSLASRLNVVSGVGLHIGMEEVLDQSRVHEYRIGVPSICDD
jgi:hypothetical protein